MGEEEGGRGEEPPRMDSGSPFGYHARKEKKETQKKRTRVKVKLKREIDRRKTKVWRWNRQYYNDTIACFLLAYCLVACVCFPIQRRRTVLVNDTSVMSCRDQRIGWCVRIVRSRRCMLLCCRGDYLRHTHAALSILYQPCSFILPTLVP